MAESTVYIDESGDLGSGKGTRWFVLSAVIVDKEKEPEIRKKMEAIKGRINVKRIHLREITDYYKRALVVKEINEFDFTYICIITDTDSHPVDYDARIADQKEKVHTAPVHIGEGVFVGARSIILKGVTIGAHSIIGAGSVVSCDIPAGCIACGNPARVIKKDDNYLQEAFNVISG